MARVVKWIVRIGLVLAALLLILAIAGAAIPLEADPVLATEQFGAGASSVEPSYSGLQRAFPDPIEPVE